MRTQTEHYLDPLLRPRSLAVLGASERPESVGRRTVENLLTGGYEGNLYAINPGYQSVCGVSCYPNLESLPEIVEHVVLVVGDARIEAALDDVIAHGTIAATMMSSLVLEKDEPPLLRERVAAKVQASGLLVCGANGMGFFNCADGVWVCGFDTRNNHIRGGNVTLISHSGSGMSGIIDCEERINFNLAVSTGQELCVSMDQYMDFALDQPETRAIGLFMESARHPQKLIAAFEKALVKNVPVVVLKVGRTELSAKLAVSHSGAIAGRDDTYAAVFDRYGVQRVDDMDELTATLMMFAQPHPIATGGLVSLHDSGGERQLLIDLAYSMDIPLAEIGQETENHLEELLDPGLPPVNPLDAWGAGGPDSDHVMEECLAALMSDENAAIGAVIHDRAPYSKIYESYGHYLRRGHQASGKPVFLVSNHQGSGADPTDVALTHEGFPMIDGLRPFLTGVRCLFAYRDFHLRESRVSEVVAPGLISKWRRRLQAASGSGEQIDEHEALMLLNEFGVTTNPTVIVENESSLLNAARSMRYPVVLKTAEAGIHHKTDVDGVQLEISSEEELLTAYRDLADRLGPRVLLGLMVPAGMEMALGMVHDEQFGPLVTMGFGGVDIEILNQVCYALPPFGQDTARRLIDKLPLRGLLDARRGRPAFDIAAYCSVAARFSAMVEAIGDLLSEVDLNPVIVHAEGCVAVDALVIPQQCQGQKIPEQ